MVGALGAGLTFCCMGLRLTVSHNVVLAEWNYRLYQLIALSNCTLATYTVVWLTFRFKKPGMSGQLKREIRARYIEYVVLYAMFSWPICLVTKPSYRYFNTLNSYVGGTIWVGFSSSADWLSMLDAYLQAIVLLSGFFIAFSRMRDRLLRQKLSNVIKRLTCRKSQTKKIAQNEATLNTFLTTSLNTELVVTILKGITILAAGSSDNTDNMTESDMLKIRQSAQIEIDQIKIGNAKMWEIGVKGQESNKGAAEVGAGDGEDSED